jgi:hypothetical protein
VDVGADAVEESHEVVAHEEHGNEDRDRDEAQDQRVLDQSLGVLLLEKSDGAFNIHEAKDIERACQIGSGVSQ